MPISLTLAKCQPEEGFVDFFIFILIIYQLFSTVCKPYTTSDASCWRKVLIIIEEISNTAAAFCSFLSFNILRLKELCTDI